jgi:hypothetical protein
MRQELKNPSGETVVVNEGEVARVKATFIDYDDGVLELSNILTMTATLRNAEDDSIINGRDNQNVLNANGGTLTDVNGEAVLTLYLDESDNANIGGLISGTETHWLDLEWTWDDGFAVRTGRSEYEYYVTVSDSVSDCGIPWIG